MGGGIKRCLTSDAWLSVAYLGPNSRTEKPRKTKLGTEVAHVTRDSASTLFRGQKIKGQGHQSALVGCSSHYIIYMDDTVIITRTIRCLSIMNIHGARRAERRRRKAFMGWSWAAACCVNRGGGISCGLAHSLFMQPTHR